jgi:hypothetical protein
LCLLELRAHGNSTYERLEQAVLDCTVRRRRTAARDMSGRAWSGYQHVHDPGPSISHRVRVDRLRLDRLDPTELVDPRRRL